MYSIEYKQKIANQLTKYYVSGEFWKLILNNPEKPWICQWISDNDFKKPASYPSTNSKKIYSHKKQIEEELIQKSYIQNAFNNIFNSTIIILEQMNYLIYK